MRKRIALAIRHKITIVFALLLFAGLAFPILVYQRQIDIIQDKLKFIEMVDDIQRYILETRRYEKNYLLYGGEENLAEIQHYLQQTTTRLTQIIPEAGRTIALEKMQHIRDLLADYDRAVAAYDLSIKSAKSPKELKASNALAETVRTIGKSVTERIVDIVKQERVHISELLNYHKNIFLYSLVLYLLLVTSAAYYLFLQVVIPLARIEKAALDITRGDMKNIPPIAGSTEIHSLVAAINRMITELDKKSDQLIQKEKMAALGTLTSGVAHELNNPLSNISSSTQILLEELGQNELAFQKKLLEGIEEQVDKARSIVKSLLEFAREEEFKPVATDVRRLIDKTIQLMSSELPAEINIQVEASEGLEAQLDPRRMSQALINLLMNGIQAMTGCSGPLVVRARGANDGVNLIIEVEDCGCGITPEALPRIFDPFFSTKDVDRGTGLGLYVTYGIIKKHNGNIVASSTPGAGTKFAITIPMKHVSETQ